MKGEEACLSLDIWSGPSPEGVRPVMVWFHGGAFVQGGGALHDGAALAIESGAASNVRDLDAAGVSLRANRSPGDHAAARRVWPCA